MTPRTTFLLTLFLLLVGGQGWAQGSYLSLGDRTLYKDGNWNTLCLPISLDIRNGSVFYGGEARELTAASFRDGTLTLNFSDPVNELKPGVPYIIRWSVDSDLENIFFTDVTLSTQLNNTTCDLGGGKSITFKGTYEQLTIQNEDKSILFLGQNNTLYYPDGTPTTTIGAYCAYFELSGFSAGEPGTEASIKSFLLNFGDEPSPVTLTTGNKTAGVWYDVSGRQLINPKSVHRKLSRGIYINNGRKIVVK